MTAIYHITHVRNLRQIAATGGLFCDAKRLNDGAPVIGIAHQHIKDRRAKRVVTAAAGGTLAEYVPFYFAPRSPMLCTISHGNVDGYDGGQSEVVHLVSSVALAVDLSQPCCFSDGHADMQYSVFYDDLDQLSSKVDWTVMRSRYWNDTPNQPDRKRKRQAEFLVQGSFPWTAIQQIGVMTEAVAAEVKRQLRQVDHKPEVVVRLGWYY